MGEAGNNKEAMHVVWVLANNTTAPYFKWFAELASKDPRIKMSFVCLYPELPQMIGDMEKFGFKCYWIKYDYHHRKSGMISASFQLYRLFRKIKPDIVHTHLFDDSLMALPAAKLAGVKIRFITKGDTGFHYYYAPKWVRFDKLNNNIATDIIAISGESKAFILEKENAVPGKVHLVHHGIPIDLVAKRNEQYVAEISAKYWLTGKIVIGTIARFIDWKGYKSIVKAAETIVKEYPDAVFVFVGKGSQKPEIESLVQEKGLNGHVVFIDWIEQAYLYSLYKLMRVYVHAAKNEPFGLVIIEAMANAVPVISTRTGAAMDAIEHRKNGYLCDYDKPEQLAEGIKYILNNNPGNVIGVAARKTCEEMFSTEVMYKNHLSLYKKALGE